MPRNPYLKNTNAHPRDTGSLVPFLDDFVALLKPSDTSSKTKDLLDSYLDYIKIRTGSIVLHNQAQSGFFHAFKKKALITGLKQCSKPRGYYVEIPRISRRSFRKTFCEEEKPVFEKRFIDKKIGFGVFACTDIPENYALVEYMGKWITQVENEKQERYYSEKNMPPVAVHDPITKLVLDANRHADGRYFNAEENIARYFNHSKVYDNCKLESRTADSGPKKLFLVTKMDVPKGAQLLWDYGENNRANISLFPWLSS